MFPTMLLLFGACISVWMSVESIRPMHNSNPFAG